MSTSEKRVKIYQITNNVTDDVYVGTTTQALYKRLYIHKADISKGVQSRLCELMRTLGKDKFKIELLEECVFANADATNARETFWMRDKRSSLNEGYPQATSLPAGSPTKGTEVKEEQPPGPFGLQPPGLREYMFHIQELQHKVQMLETQIKTIQSQT